MDQERDRKKCPFHKEVQEEQSIWGLSQRSGGNREKVSYFRPQHTPISIQTNDWGIGPVSVEVEPETQI